MQQATIEFHSLCSCSSCQEVGSTSRPGWDGCLDAWEDMITLNGLIDDGKEFGEEGEVRLCYCGLAWVLKTCAGCKKERDREQAGEDRRDAARDLAMENRNDR